VGWGRGAGGGGGRGVCREEKHSFAPWMNPRFFFNRSDAREPLGEKKKPARCDERMTLRLAGCIGWGPDIKNLGYGWGTTMEALVCAGWLRLDTRAKKKAGEHPTASSLGGESPLLNAKFRRWLEIQETPPARRERKKQTIYRYPTSS